MSQPTNYSEVRRPWKCSANGAVYCNWEDLTDDIRALLKTEDGFKVALGEFHYFVRKYGDSSVVVFRNKQQKRFFSGCKKNNYQVVNEIRVIPIVEANKLLADSEYEVVGSDPVKVVNGHFFVVIGKKNADVGIIK